MPTFKFVEVEGAAMFKRDMKRKVTAMMMIKKTDWINILSILDCHGTF